MAPINLNNIQAGTKNCNDTCNLTYNFSDSNCIIKNKNREYLEIQCYDGNYSLKYDKEGELFINEVRLYNKTLNQYKIACDSEIIIHCFSKKGADIFICIPIKKSTSVSNSTNWFNQIIQYAPHDSNTLNVNVKNFSLNDIIPFKSPFYIVNKAHIHKEKGKSPNNSKIIIFNNTILMSTDDFNSLNTKLNSNNDNDNDNEYESLNTFQVTYNSKGAIHTTNKNDGIDELLSCQLVEGGILSEEPEKESNLVWMKNKLSGRPDFMSVIYNIVAIFVILLILFIVIKLLLVFKNSLSGLNLREKISNFRMSRQGYQRLN